VAQVATANARSLRAHAKVGFEPLARYGHVNEEWVIVARPLARAGG
jgi:RimJ/RimL family protein N-acetyltransferase